MKTLKAIALSIAMLIPTASFATHRVDNCVAQSNLFVIIAMVRTFKGHPDTVYNILIQRGMKEDTALSVLTLVFHTMKDVPPADIGTLIFDKCIGEDT